MSQLYSPSVLSHQSTSPSGVSLAYSGYSATTNDPQGDVLPEYSCTVSFASILMQKRELDAFGQPCRRRPWVRVGVEILGTTLLISRARSIQQLQDLVSGCTKGCTKGCTTRMLTLQGAEAGLATDYKKRAFVVRVRAEGEQFLLEAPTLATAFELVEKLNQAIEISLPLEERSMASGLALPRRRIVKALLSLPKYMTSPTKPHQRLSWDRDGGLENAEAYSGCQTAITSDTQKTIVSVNIAAYPNGHECRPSTVCPPASEIYSTDGSSSSVEGTDGTEAELDVAGTGQLYDDVFTIARRYRTIEELIIAYACLQELHYESRRRYAWYIQANKKSYSELSPMYSITQRREWM